MIVTTLAKSNSGCDYHRVSLPFEYINKNDLIIKEIIRPDSLTRDVLAKSNILYFNRTPINDLGVIIDHRALYNYKIIVDIDDYWKLYPHHYLYKDWKNGDMERQLINCLIHADVVITTNDRLAEKVKEHNKNVKIIPNALPFGSGQFNKIKVKSNKVRISLTGGASHYFDIKSIQYLFEKCKSDSVFRDKAEFHMVDDGSYLSVRLKNMVSSCCKSNFVSDHYHMVNEYMNIYSNSDIVLAPLEDNSFNTYKSNLKILEAGCKAIPILCTNIHPYLEDKEMNGNGIFLCSKISEWYSTLKKLVIDDEFRISCGENLYNYVKNKYSLEDWNKIRYETLKSIANGTSKNTT